MRVVAVPRAGSVPASPVYQTTVLAVLPAVIAVAVSKGGPATRCGGVLRSALKKSFEAVTADAALSEELASELRAVESAPCKFVTVAAVLPPIVNWLAPGGDFVVAVRVRLVEVPSGRSNRTVSVSPSLGCPVKFTVRLAGGPVGPETVALLRLDDAEASLKPNGPASSSSVTEEAVPPTVRRPRPLAPRSACARSSMSCFRPARAPSPLTI